MDEKNQDLILRVDDLKTYFNTLDGVVRAVDGVSLTLKKGETLGVVGESGCGKSVTAFSILRLLPKTSMIAGGEMIYYRSEGQEALDLAQIDPNSEIMRNVRGGEIAMIFQEPMASFSPVHTVGFQITEGIRLHQDVSQERRARSPSGCSTRVSMPPPERIIDRYPHQLSGGMRQRAMIGMALLPAQPADRRRTDDGARRDDPGADPRPDAATFRTIRHGDLSDHPRPGRRSPRSPTGLSSCTSAM